MSREKWFHGESLDYFNHRAFNRRMPCTIRVFPRFWNLKMQSQRQEISASRIDILSIFSISFTRCRFTETLVGIQRRHANIVPLLAKVIHGRNETSLSLTFSQAYMEMDQSGTIDTIEKNRLQYFYDRFFMNRIGIRTLIYQHSTLFPSK